MDNTYSFIGARLKKDIFNRNGMILLPRGTILNLGHIDKLINLKIEIKQCDVEDCPSFLLEMNKTNNIHLIQNSINKIEEIFALVRSGEQIPLFEIRDTIIPSINQVVQDRKVLNLLIQLQECNEYTYLHSIAVSIISTIIGEWLNLPTNELELLTVGAILHDIGKTKVPLEILNKPGSLTAEEYIIIKKHATSGYNLIKNTAGASHRIALIALEHHEREDGSGYPFGITSTKIDYLSKIVAVADVFHAMTSDRVYHKAKSFYQVLQEMRDEIFGKLNPNIITVFLTRIMELLIGNKALLSDGRIGTIITVNPSNPIKPIIKLDDNQIIDLNTNHSVKLMKLMA